MPRSLWSSRSAVVAALTAVLLAVASCGGDTTESSDPLSIGLLTNNPNGMRNVAGFIEGMADLGYVDGDNVTYHFANEPLKATELDEALATMVAADVDLIFTAGTPTGIAAQRATEGTDIPVVFGVIADPIRAGVMDDLTEPGGNMTGVKTSQDHGRRLELLLELVPEVRTVLVPFDPLDAAAASAVEQIRIVAGGLDVELLPTELHTESDVLAFFDNLESVPDAVFLVPDSTVNAHLDLILAATHAVDVPTSGPSTAQVEEGAFTAFGFVHREAGVQAASIAHRILNGADPATMPVENTESFLAINLATADLIGIEVSDATLRQAAVVIRAGGTG